MNRRRQQPVTELARYSRCAERAAATVIATYSTSFGVATRLLAPPLRPHITNVYALVRLADEVVDGSAGQAGLGIEAQRRRLDELEAETARAIGDGYSANLVVHAFAATARRAGIGADLTAPFFASMRRDLDPTPLGEEDVREYIYGSAEVVGLMCLQVFLHGELVDDDRRERLTEGARRLGAAFQKVNFLRDLATDWGELGRNYFPSTTPGALTDSEKRLLVADIDSDLAAAARVIPELPRGCRRAVGAAHALFSALAERLRATPALDLRERRVRVPAAAKTAIVVTALVRGRKGAA
jgi:phytoene/squalene synthetase